MFCMKCGSVLDGSLKFCTKCGAAIEDDGQDVCEIRPEAPAYEGVADFASVDASGLDVMAVSGGYAAQGAPSSQARSFAPAEPANSVPCDEGIPRKPEKKKKAKRTIIAVTVILFLVAAIGVVAYTMKDKASGVEVYYATDVKVKVASDSVVVAYSKSDEPLEKYDVTIRPENVEEELSWDNASISVEGGKGFSISDFGDIPKGTYSLEIVDTNAKDDEYWCPQIEVVGTGSEDAAETVLLKADPDDPEGATSKPPAEYDYEPAVSEVEFVYHGPNEYMQVDEKWTYVQFTCSQESEAVNALNASIKQAFDDELQAAKDWDMETSSDAQCIIHRESVVRCEGSFASVREERYLTMWGAHGGSEVSGTTYNLETGAEVTPESLLNLTTAEMQDKAREALKAYYRANPSDILTASDVEECIEELIVESDRYYVAEEGIVFVVNAYELGSYAFGGREIVIAAFEDDSLVATDVKSKYSEIV